MRRLQGLLLLDSPSLWLLAYNDFETWLCTANTPKVDLIRVIVRPEEKDFVSQYYEDFVSHYRKRQGIFSNIAFIDYNNSLQASVKNNLPVNTTLDQYEIMMITNDPIFQAEIRQNPWFHSALKEKRGELNSQHIDNMRQKIQENPSKKIVLSLDLDEALIFFEDSLRLGRIVFNYYKIMLLINFFIEHHERDISVIFLTCRNKTQDEQRSRQFMTAANIAKALYNLLKIEQLSPEKINIHYAEPVDGSKYHKLGELYSASDQSLVFHLDDDPRWWRNQNPIHPHLSLVEVKHGQIGMDLHRRETTIYALLLSVTKNIPAQISVIPALTSNPVETHAKIQSPTLFQAAASCPTTQLAKPVVKSEEMGCCSRLLSWFMRSSPPENASTNVVYGDVPPHKMKPRI